MFLMKVGGVPPFEASEYRLKGRSYSKARKTLTQEVVFVPSWFLSHGCLAICFRSFCFSLFFFGGGGGNLKLRVWGREMNMLKNK